MKKLLCLSLVFAGLLLPALATAVTNLTVAYQFDLSSVMGSVTGGTCMEGDVTSLASDGTSIYLYQNCVQGSAKIWKIDPSTGTITATYNLTLSYGNTNGIESIHDMTWYNGALWATGGYASAPNTLKQGIFRINLSTSLSESQIPAGSGLDTGGEAAVAGLASDGTNFYVSVDLWGSNSDIGIVKFNPTTSTTVPSSPFLSMGCRSWDMDYSEGYLWMDGCNYIDKVDPTTGDIIEQYAGGGDDGILYLNNLLWMIEDTKLIAYYTTSSLSLIQTLTPPSNTTVSRGSALGPFSATITNNTSSSYSFYVYLYIGTPDGNWFSISPSRLMTLSGGQTFSTNNLYIRVPSIAQTGTTYYQVSIYDTSYNVIDEDWFSFEVVSSSSTSGSNMHHDWGVSGWSDN